MIARKAVLLMLALGCGLWPRAVQAQGVEAWVQTAQAQGLARHPGWLSLLHYENRMLPGSPWQSLVLSESFFLHPQGGHDPEAELEADLAAMLQPPAPETEHFVCRFPARSRFLAAQLGLPRHLLPTPPCPRLGAWLSDKADAEVNLIFATGYFGNPASYFGHILLGFRQSGSWGPGLMDNALNYGAQVPENTQGLVYLAKGMLGGFEAGFSGQKFYRLQLAYGERELRDLWVYPLHLTPAQRMRLLLRLWELEGVRFEYYFLKQNCALKMTQLVEEALTEELVSPHTLWVLPSDLFFALKQKTNQGMPLLGTPRFVPSRQVRLRLAYGQLTASEQALLRALLQDAATSLETADLPPESRIRLAEALMEYYEFLRLSSLSPKEKTQHQQALDQVVALRSRLEAGARLRLEPDPPPHPPTEATPPTSLRLGWAKLPGVGSGPMIGWRAGYHDLLGNPQGQMPGAGLTLLDLRLAQLGETWLLEGLDLFDIENLNLSLTGLPGEGGWAWRLHAGWLRHDPACGDCAAFQLQGRVGKALFGGPWGVPYLMAQGSLHPQSEREDAIQLGAVAGWWLQAGTIWSMRLEASNRFVVAEAPPEPPQPLWLWEQRLGTSNAWDTRLTLRQNGASAASRESALSLNWYY